MNPDRLRRSKACLFGCGLNGLATLALGVGMVLPLRAAAPQEPTGPVSAESQRLWMFSARWENDTFGGSDRFYTDGVSLSLSHTGPSWLDPVADRLPWGEGRRTVGYDVGQIMVTPSNTRLAVPDPHDRPYAGILYAGLALHIEQDNRYYGLKFITGVVGPWSLAEEAQKQVHRWIGSSLPAGWDYQLHNEPVLNLIFEHRRKFRLAGGPGRLAVEALPLGNLMLGNVLTQADAGLQVRLGYNVPDDFGMTLMRGMVHLPPPRPAPAEAPPWSVYVYVGGAANLVARNITLDGNTWRESRRVDKEWFVPAAEVGMAVSVYRLTAAFAYVFWGREFVGQRDYSEFGALTVSYRF